MTILVFRDEIEIPFCYSHVSRRDRDFRKSFLVVEREKIKLTLVENSRDREFSLTSAMNRGGGFGKGDYINVNLDEVLPPANEIAGNEKVNNQLESEQFGFEAVDLSKKRHCPLSDPLNYNEPKLTVESGVQCNRCPRTFKTFTNLKQHMARSHKVDSSKSKEERSSVIKNEREGQSSLHNIPAHLVTEDLQREIIVSYMRCLFF